MINAENEYKKLFKYQKRLARHWFSPSTHRSRSGEIGFRRPAKESFDYINELEAEKMSYKERTELLLKFYKKNRKGNSGYYDPILYGFEGELKSIQNGNTVWIPKITR